MHLLCHKTCNGETVESDTNMLLLSSANTVFKFSYSKYIVKNFSFKLCIYKMQLKDVI